MKSLFLFLAPCLFLSCNSSTAKKPALSDTAIQWIFSNQGVFMNENGIAFQGNNLIRNYMNANPIDLSSWKSLYSVPASGDSTIQYEIGTAKNKLNESYTILSIWKKDQSIKKSELIFVGKSNPSQVPLNELKNRRDEWMKLCNQHRVSSLVEELYTPDALYFNHKPLIKGTADITKEYDYMNKPNYHLDLAPLHIETVTDSLIFEIGQGSGSYGGKYILIWKKNTQGKWMVYMDSNI